MASPAGVEPATLRLETARSGQLSYGDKVVFPGGVEPPACALGPRRSGQLSYGNVYEIGWWSWNRTSNLSGNNRRLYQLSYPPVA